MKSFISLVLLVALLVGATILSVHAQSGGTGAAGAIELKFLTSLFTGGIGKTVGLLVAFLGAYTAIVKGQGAFGVVLIVLGVLIVMLPGVYNGIRAVTCPIAEALTTSGACGHSADWLGQ